MTPRKRVAETTLDELRRSIADQQSLTADSSDRRVFGGSNIDEPLQSMTEGSQDCPPAASSAASRPSSDEEAHLSPAVTTNEARQESTEQTLPPSRQLLHDTPASRLCKRP